MMVHLGLDLGGTWLRACLARDGKLRRARLPAVPWRELPRALPALRRKLGFRSLDRLVLGSRGVWRAADRRAAARLLRGAAREVVVLSDVELAHRAAFAGGPGVLVIGGTGSVAFRRDARGRTARAGGLGPLLGDEGSAFWVGREALRRGLIEADPLRFAHAADPVSAVAALAPRALKHSARLRREAAAHLAELAAEASPGALPVSWRGGLFENPAFLAAFRRALPRRLTPRPPQLEAEVAAATLRM